MTGGVGNDTYLVDNAGDVVVEQAGGGTDQIKSSVTYTLLANVENLALTGTDHLNGTGNEFANALVGNSGDNILDGLVGADTMTGGAGNDTYLVDNAGDVVLEQAGGGTDQVKSSLTYTLLANVENLTLTGTDHLNGTGNELANALVGNSGNNILDGLVGADTMTGGDGNDAYFVDNVGDIVTESNPNAAGGTDIVHSYLVAYTLGANVENGRIRLDGAANFTGNALDNTLYAGSGDNVMAAGEGNDTLSYLFASANVTVSLAVSGAQATGGSGSDTLTGFENLTGSGYGDLLTGNSGNNILKGGGGDDTLVGGVGNDTLIGGSGSDKFKFLSTAGVDDITDFTSGSDKIQVMAGTFGLTAGSTVTLRTGTNPQASGKVAQFLYHTDSGDLYFDHDGTGSAAAIHFVTLVGLPALASSDIQVVS
ncbi:serralysin [Gammaproteobacteria bacterium]